jgi:spore coat polysaccharide biosynthesis protein SpsF
MMPVAGMPLIGRVVERAKRAQTTELTAVVTGSEASNRELAAWASRTGTPVFFGSDDDVLERYARAARHFGADVIVRVTGDCPLLDPVVIDEVVRRFVGGGFDYVSNIHPPTFPDGLDVEVLSLDALERAAREATLASEREHVTPYVWKQPACFRLSNYESPYDLSGLRWTVDDARDLAFVQAVYEELALTPNFGMTEILGLLRRQPELSRINAGTSRNEGYALSLSADRPIR